MLSRTAAYALKTVLYLAEHGQAGPVRAGIMARALDVPQNYLSKTCHVLAGAGVLVSVRGPAGGFRLARDPRRMSLLSVVRHFDPVGGTRRCLFGQPTCSDRAACAVHQYWKRAADEVAHFFRTTTVADIVAPRDTATLSIRRRA